MACELLQEIAYLRVPYCHRFDRQRGFNWSSSSIKEGGTLNFGTTSCMSTSPKMSESVDLPDCVFVSYNFDIPPKLVGKGIVGKDIMKRKLTINETEVYRKLKNTVDKFLSMSGYSEVNLSKLFQTFSIVKSVGDPSNERQ
ncbi:DNA polymerase alpha catalytic subunit [Chelonia mydas]|uniref:DNA polymerase alpha catalytic subunit n=1 Tax=Chelonia mydas TaxID=8469 RepID=M7AM96_CHEMY|nr:DNA polymerase alpha catalytic subunit [Chelonia mydas]